MADVPKITIQPVKRIKITLDLSDQDAFDLMSSIDEARHSMDDWRSNPDVLVKLQGAVSMALEHRGDNRNWAVEL